jgi:hypothetical protein
MDLKGRHISVHFHFDTEAFTIKATLGAIGMGYRTHTIEYTDVDPFALEKTCLAALELTVQEVFQLHQGQLHECGWSTWVEENRGILDLL